MARKRAYRKENLAHASAALARIRAEKKRLKELEPPAPKPKPKPKPTPKPPQPAKHLSPAMQQRLDKAKQKLRENVEKRKAHYAQCCERLRLARQRRAEERAPIPSAPQPNMAPIPSTPQPYGPLKRSFRLRISD